ncbi:HD domain-containing phosphohydrolase [uncultured Thermanaerothrix sp.]|uniref:HD domain-containing phosphohydrolase n=1 Tax=uncultured Thermanaerothrix sp. TaxID=1195149 RepID=UPI00262BAD81|nr:HD domain-containing phosphohydrolase [uncultured Thermanaerothrix sp.]
MALSNPNLEAILQVLPVAASVEDQNGNILAWNADAAKLFGWSAQEVLHRPGPYWPDEAWTFRQNLWKKTTASPHEFEIDLKNCNGDIVHTRLRAALLTLSAQEQVLLLTFRSGPESPALTETLVKSQATLSTLLANLPGAAYRCRNDPQWKMEFISQGCYTLTGYPPEDFINNRKRSFADIILPEDRQQVWEQVQEAVEEHRPYQLVYRIRNADGRVRWVWEQGRGIFDASGRLQALEGYISDITDLKQREEELEVITNLSHALRSARSRHEVYPIILARLNRHLNAEGVILVSYDPANKEIIYEKGLGCFEDLAGKHTSSERGILGWVIANAQVHLVDQVTPDLDPDLVFSPTVQSLLAVPLIDHEQTLGALAVARSHSFSLNEVRLVTAIADIAAVTLRRVILAEQTEKRLNQMTALRTIETAINANLDLRFTLNILLDQVIHRLNVDAVDIWIYHEQSGRLSYSGGYGFRGLNIRTTPLQLEYSLPGIVARRGTPLFIPDLRESETPTHHSVPLEEEGFIAYYGLPLISRGRLHGVLELFHRKPLSLDSDQKEFLESLVSTTAIAIDNARLIEDLKRSNIELIQAYDETILGWSLALEMRDSSTENHTRRVAEMTVRLAQAMGISGEDLVQIRRGAILHDIGKMAIPDHILRKTGSLTEEEAAIMRLHPLFARQMLESIAFLRPALAIPTYHHERWDGTGYPFGLKGEEIPLPARIFAIVDVWDALRHDRPYRAAWPEEKVRAYLQEESGGHFDPQVVEHFLRLLDSLEGEEI